MSNGRSLSWFQLSGWFIWESFWTLISFRASPAQKRVEKLLSVGDVFLSYEEQPVSSWLELLGVLSSMIQLVPGGWLRMRSLQFVLSQSWDQVDQSVLIRWIPEIRQDLEWWLNRARLEQGISLAQVSPQLDLWSDASDVGSGAHLGKEVTSGLWSREEVALSINARELLVVEELFSSLLRNSGCVRGQLYGNRLPSQPRGHSVSAVQLHFSAHPAVGGVSAGSFGSAIHNGS